jgi:hypothetical protein
MTTTLVIYANSGDCYATNTGTFDNSWTGMYVGAESGDDDVQTWIPFTVNLAKGTQLISATLDLIAAATSSAVTSNIQVGCEAADNASNPSSKADLFGRSMTSAYSVVTLLQYVLGAGYSYDVTSALQEVLDRSGWVYGNQAAVLIRDVDTADKPHLAYSSEAGGIYRPYLTIVVPSYVPRSSGVI